MTRDIGFTAAAGDSGSELALKPYRRDICATYVMLTLTTAALVLAFRQLGGSLVHELAAHQWSIAIGQLAFMLVVALLLWGNFVYQLTRLGHVYRCATHRPALREDLERTYDDHAQPLAILVPSYKEEIGVVRCALLSAALQEYPGRRVALLIDDPPHPQHAGSIAALTALRELPHQLQALFDAAATDFVEAEHAYHSRRSRTGLIERQELDTLAHLYRRASYRVNQWGQTRCCGSQPCTTSEH
ncbi:MAG: hypothetical protein E6K41_15395, partial [Gammaproteobacteria bacterium]